MCVAAIKYIDGYGWCSAKNRDRSSKVKITLKRSFRRNTERLIMLDQNSHWQEGLNEHGLSITNTTLMNSKDKKEASNSQDPNFASPGGKLIREALFEKTPKAALNFLIKNEMEGFSAIYNETEAYLLEGFFTINDDGEADEYKHHVTKCKKDEVYVRTNHGINLPEAGYQDGTGDEEQQAFYESSVSRYETALKSVNDSEINTPRDLMNAIAITPHDDWHMNPLRRSPTHGSHIYQTTGQLLAVPSSKTLHYRSIWCELEIDANKISDHNCMTAFEILSSNDMISDKKESLNHRSFKEWLAG